MPVIMRLRAARSCMITATGHAEGAQDRGEDVGQRPAAVVGQPEGSWCQRAVARDSAAAKPRTRLTASAPSAASLTRSAMSSADAVPV